MTHPFSSFPVATPTQRNRRLLLTLPAACALPMLSACGGGADLSYDTEQALYIVGEAITPNNPQLTTHNPNTAGHTAPTFSVWPALPAGLALNAQTGVISGTPTKLRRQASHTVIARNNRGFAETQVRITVTGRGAWSPAAAMPGGWVGASMSPLPGGQFLVAGGATAAGTTNTAHIYDPSLDAWRPAAPMLGARYLHSAVVLRDGRVLVLGGDLLNPGPPELYDPVANTWTATRPMNEARFGCTAHVLANGNVLVVGGESLHQPLALTTAERYDPVTGDWTLLPARLSDPRLFHAAALLPDRKTLLVAGGRGETSAELYKVDGSATKAISFGGAGDDHQAVNLDDGSVLVISSDSNQSRRFNPVNSSWSTSAMVHGLRAYPIVTLLADGRVLAAGGAGSNTAEIYNPDVNRWTAATPMLNARLGAAAALLADGSVLVAGGDNGSGVALDVSERYVP